MDNYAIIISSKAQSGLASCVSFALNVSKEAVINLIDDIYASIQSLDVFPERHPVFEMPKPFPFEIRKLVVNQRYVVLYAIEQRKVVVYRILDSRRKLDYLIS